MRTLGHVMTLAAALFACAPAQAAPGNADRKFMADAAADGMAEAALGRLAVDRASRQDVKDFGKRMADHHTRAKAELEGLAQKKDVTLPAAPKQQHKALEARLARLSGAAFDKEFMAAIVKLHRKAVTTVTRASDGAPDDDVQAWATRTLPALRRHLADAQELDRAVRAGK